jgi:hypothetical protein
LRSHAIDVADPSSVAHVCAASADADNVTRGGDGAAGILAQSDIVAAGGVVCESEHSIGRIVPFIQIPGVAELADALDSKAGVLLGKQYSVAVSLPFSK